MIFKNFIYIMVIYCSLEIPCRSGIWSSESHSHHFPVFAWYPSLPQDFQRDRDPSWPATSLLTWNRKQTQTLDLKSLKESWQGLWVSQLAEKFSILHTSEIPVKCYHPNSVFAWQIQSLTLEKGRRGDNKEVLGSIKLPIRQIFSSCFHFGIWKIGICTGLSEDIQRFWEVALCVRWLRPYAFKAQI